MLLWIESQESGVIIALVFLLSYFAALLVYLMAVAFSRRGVAADLKATTPVMLTPLSVIAGLLIAFLASHIWSNFDSANAYVAREASSLRETVSLTDVFPPDLRTTIVRDAKRYVRFVETHDWPAMAQGRANLRAVPVSLVSARNALLAFEPTTAGQKIAQKLSVGAIEKVMSDRRRRILLSEAAISPLQWLVIVILSVLVLITMAMVHIDRRVTMAVSLFLFSTAVASCLVLLLINDRPFGAGGETVRPRIFQEISIP